MGFLKHPTTYLIVVIAALALIVIVPFAGYVLDPTAFWIIFAGLLASSFMSSAIEASYSGKASHSDPNSPFSEEFANYKTKQAGKITELVEQASEAEAGSKQAIKIHNKLKRLKRKLDEVERSLSGERRSVYVGTFATVSLFLNTALVAFLPIAMVEPQTQISALTISHPIVHMDEHCADGMLICGSVGEMAAQSIVTQKVFLFVAVSIPLLLLGKIIPKHLGATYPWVFSLRMRGFNRVVVFLLGWIPAGAITLNDWIVISGGWALKSLSWVAKNAMKLLAWLLENVSKPFR